MYDVMHDTYLYCTASCAAVLPVASSMFACIYILISTHIQVNNITQVHITQAYFYTYIVIIITQVYSCNPHPTKVPHPHAKQVFMCNYVTGSAGMTCQHIGADKQYYVVLIVAQCCCRDV